MELQASAIDRVYNPPKRQSLFPRRDAIRIQQKQRPPAVKGRLNRLDTCGEKSCVCRGTQPVRKKQLKNLVDGIPHVLSDAQANVLV